MDSRISVAGLTSGRLAAVCCGASLVILGLLIVVFPKASNEVKAPLLSLVPILWVAGVLALTPIVRAERSLLTTGSGLLYAVAFLLPVATTNAGEDTVWGFQAFAYGFLVVPFAWLANLAFAFALAARRGGQRWRVLVLTIVGIVLALTAPLMLRDFAMSVGFFAWALAPAVLAVSVSRQERPVTELAFNAPETA